MSESDGGPVDGMGCPGSNINTPCRARPSSGAQGNSLACACTKPPICTTCALSRIAGPFPRAKCSVAGAGVEILTAAAQSGHYKRRQVRAPSPPRLPGMALHNGIWRLEAAWRTQTHPGIQKVVHEAGRPWGYHNSTRCFVRLLRLIAVPIDLDAGS